MEMGELKSHPFFAEIDWRRLRDRDVVPPFKPVLHPRVVSPFYPLNASVHFDLEQVRSGANYGSPSSYQTTSSTFGTLSRSIYATPASYADVGARGSILLATAC